MLAGGTDLLLRLKRRQMVPRCLVNLKTIPELVHISYEDKDGLRLGPLTTHATLEESALLNRRFPILAETARSMGPPQIRNLGTIGGNLCNADSSADMVPPLVLLGAKVRILSVGGEMIC